MAACSKESLLLESIHIVSLSFFSPLPTPLSFESFLSSVEDYIIKTKMWTIMTIRSASPKPNPRPSGRAVESLS